MEHTCYTKILGYIEGIYCHQNYIFNEGWNICEVEHTWYTNPGPVSQWPLTADSPSANTADSNISDSEKQVRKFAFCTIKLVEEKKYV